MKSQKKEDNINYISLVDNYYYSADKYNYILYYFNKRNKIDIVTKTITNEIIESYDILGYYQTLESLILATVTYCSRISILNGEITTLKESVEKIINISERLISMLK